MDNASLPTPAEILTATRTAAREVAIYQRSVVRTAVRRDHKLDKHDLVTEHDRRCEQIATASLRAALPAAQIVGEEYGVQPPALAAEDAGLTFFIDPIDGTSNFVAGMPTFAVSIGAALDGELVAGVVNAPMLGHEFYAGAGLGAWVASFDTEGPVQLGEARNRMAGECLVLTGFPNARDLGQWGPEGGELARALQRDVMAVRNVGSSAIELAFVAAGWVDG
ncbi:MAG TPA: inositol monophosphatase, partial [Actinomycetales bacterium]|nr:inositol monophosphatase [Actinomycetales bacterium]